MGYKRRRVTLITNFVLFLGLFAVFALSFIPETAVPIYGGEEIKAIYGGNSKSGVSLTFNVYENKAAVEKIVEILDEYNAKATFFVGGCWADDNEATLYKILKSGHELGGHGYFHKDHAKLDYEGNREEIYLTGVMVKALCGYDLKLFAPPSGSYSDATLKAAANLGQKVIMWTKDTIDWRDSDEAKIIKRATDNLKGGDVILMHPKDHTVKALPEILKKIYAAGFTAITVGENLNG